MKQLHKNEAPVGAKALTGAFGGFRVLKKNEKIKVEAVCERKMEK